jgi:hypothetical protein
VSVSVSCWRKEVAGFQNPVASGLREVSALRIWFNPVIPVGL